MQLFGRGSLPLLFWVGLCMLVGLSEALPHANNLPSTNSMTSTIAGFKNLPGLTKLTKRAKPHRQAKFQPPGEITTVYRGERRSPEAIEKAGGFYTKQVLEKLTAEQEEASSSLWAHVTQKTNQYTKYVSTTADPSVAYNFAAAAKNADGGWVYVISPDKQMVDTTGTLGDHVELRFRNEYEYSAVGRIPFEQIRGWYSSKSIPERDIERLRSGETLEGFVKNPRYDTRFDATRSSGVRYELAGFGAEVKDAWKDKNFKKLKGKSTAKALDKFVKEVVCGNNAACSANFWKPSTSGSSPPPEEETPGKKQPADEGSKPPGEEPQPGTSGTSPKKPQAGGATGEDAKTNKGKKIPGSGTDGNELLGKKQKGIKSPCVISRKRAIDCDVTERAKYDAATEFEHEYRSVGKTAQFSYQAREVLAEEERGVAPVGSAAKLRSQDVLSRILPAKGEFLTMNVINQLQKNSTAFWEELVYGLENGDFTISDCQIGFKRALSNTINRRYTEFDNVEHALGSIFNIAMDTLDLYTLRPPPGFYMDLVAELPKMCKVIAGAKTPEEKMKLADEDVDTLVQVWAEYTPVGIENEKWAERLVKNPSPDAGKAAVTTIYDFWSMTPVGWIFNQIFPSVSPAVEDWVSHKMMI